MSILRTAVSRQFQFDVSPALEPAQAAAEAAAEPGTFRLPGSPSRQRRSASPEAAAEGAVEAAAEAEAVRLRPNRS